MVAFIDVLFWFSSIYIFPFWLMMWFAPTHERTAALMRNEWIYLAPLAAAYTLAVLPNLVDILVLLGSDMPSPDIVVEMFSEREVILIGWLHYLAFDLFVGRWTWQRLVAAFDVCGTDGCPDRHDRHPRVHVRTGNQRCGLSGPCINRTMRGATNGGVGCGVRPLHPPHSRTCTPPWPRSRRER